MSAGARCLGYATCGLVLAFAPLISRSLLALAVLARLTGAPLPAALAGRLHTALFEEPVEIRIGSGVVRGRRYVAAALKAEHPPGVLLLHGVHARGIDEPRLVSFARTLAQGGLAVLTPELSALTHYRLDPALTGEIRALAAAHAAATNTPAVGVIGISFAGGLALLAAAEQAADRPIGFVATVGAHADLVRLCQYYAGHDVRGPNGERADVPPHPYGARVMLRPQLARFLAPADLATAERAHDLYLHDQHREARALGAGLSPAGQRFMATVLSEQGSPLLSSWLDDVTAVATPQLTAASPHGHLGDLRVPVYLLHGTGDPIIPSFESAYLARELPPGQLHALVISKLLRHAEFPTPPTPGQAWELVSFVRRLLEAAGSAARL